MKVIRFRDEAERLNVHANVIKKTFQKSLQTSKMSGFINDLNEEIITYQPEEISSLVASLNSRIIYLAELSEDSGLSIDQVKLLISEHLNWVNIKGTISADERSIPYSILQQLLVEKANSLEKIDFTKIAADLSVSEADIQKCLGSIEENLLKAVAPYSQIKLGNLSEESKLSPTFTLAIVKKLIGENRLLGSLDSINGTLIIESTHASVEEPTNSESPKVYGAKKSVTPYQVNTSSSKMGVAVFGIFLLIIIIGGAIWYGSVMSTPSITKATFTIVIESDTSWMGSIGGLASSTSVQGYGDDSYQGTSTVVSAVIQKETDYGYLTVKILKNGDVVAQQSTSADYGVVSLSAIS